MASKAKKVVKLTLEGLGVAALLAVLMLWLAGAFRSKTPPGPATPETPAKGVRTVAVEERTFPLLIEEVGATAMETEAQVSSRITAEVREVLVREGDAVTGPDSSSAGAEVMARLDDRDVQARLRQAQATESAAERFIDAAKAHVGTTNAQLEAAKARLVQAEAEYNRQQEMVRQRVSTTQLVERARADRDVAQAQVRSAEADIEAAKGDVLRFQAQKEEAEAALSEARVALSYTVIQAPFTGRVTKKLVNPGDTVNVGQGLFVVETSSRPEFHASIAESLLASVKIGQKLTVTIDALKRTFDGTVSEIIPKVDPVTRTVLVKVALPPDPSLISGLFGRVAVTRGEYEALVLPSTCVREVGQLELVDVLDDKGVAHRRFVTLGEPHGDAVEVLSGLKAGERVVRP